MHRSRMPAGPRAGRLSGNCQLCSCSFPHSRYAHSYTRHAEPSPSMPPPSMPQCKYHKNFMALVTGGFGSRVSATV
jgi:hypothetical protein